MLPLYLFFFFYNFFSFNSTNLRCINSLTGMWKKPQPSFTLLYMVRRFFHALLLFFSLSILFYSSLPLSYEFKVRFWIPLNGRLQAQHRRSKSFRLKQLLELRVKHQKGVFMRQCNALAFQLERPSFLFPHMVVFLPIIILILTFQLRLSSFLECFSILS